MEVGLWCSDREDFWKLGCQMAYVGQAQAIFRNRFILYEMMVLSVT